MGLVEVVKLKETDPKVLEAATAFVKAQKKTPVCVADTPGACRWYRAVSLPESLTERVFRRPRVYSCRFCR